MSDAAAVVWVFVDGLGLAAPPLAPAGASPGLDARLGGRALLDAPLGPAPLGRRYALDATLGVEGLPGTATGQASLVTGDNAPRAMGRHMQAYPGPRLRAWIDAAGSVFSRTAERGLCAALLTTYPASAPETVLRYAARTGGAALAGARDGPDEPLFPNLGLRPFDRAGPDDARVAARAATLAARLARPYDLSVVETDLCDRAGHLREGRESAVARALGFIDAFLVGLRAELGGHDLLVVASDHGNAEDARGRGHTRSRVPVFALAGRPGVDWGVLEGDLTGFAPWLEGLVGRVRGGP